MSRSCPMKHTLMIAGLLIGLLFAILAVPLGAATAPVSRARHGIGPAYYNAAHETTLIGTIKEVVSKRVIGSPVGIHLMVAGPQGVVDTHVGPFLSKRTVETLKAGAPVRIVGATVSRHGKELFLARLLTVGGRTVTVRTPHGIIVREHPSRVRHSKPERKTARKSQVELNGGAR